jgi:hypothetical protein
MALSEQLQLVRPQILENGLGGAGLASANSLSRLESIRRGPLISTALVASVPDPKPFRPKRDLSAWMGSYLSRTPPAARRSWEASARPGAAIYGNCWSLAPLW